MNRILITGAQSFIGTNFRNYSKNKINREISLKENNPEDIDFAEVDVILHLAAIVHQTRRIKTEEYFLINRDLCFKIAKLAKQAGVKQFIFLSSVKVYGQFLSGSESWKEDSKCFPVDAYGQSKYEAELELKKLESPDFIISIVRTPIVYGSGVKANISNLIRLIQFFKVLPFGQIKNQRNFTYIENLIAFIDRIIEKRISGTFIAMDDKSLSSSELVTLIAKYLNRKLCLFKLPAIFIKAGEFILPGQFKPIFGSIKLDNSKTKELLDFHPPFTIEDGIKKMIRCLNE
jgi:nucleoside-diphosphate-sugar epimerase